MNRILFKILSYTSFILRVFLPFVVFLFPFSTSIAMVLLDWVDGVFYRQIGISNRIYNSIDKSLDLYWYVVAFIYAWIFLPFRNIFIVLFAIRLSGNVIYYFLRNDKVFIFFPNVFEWFFIFVVFARTLPKYSYLTQGANLCYWFIFLVVVKLIQEIHAHIFAYRVNDKAPSWMRIPGVD